MVYRTVTREVSMAIKQSSSHHTKARAKSTAVTGEDIRDRIHDLSVDAFRDRRLKLKDVSKLIHDVLDGAVDGIDSEVPKGRSSVLREVFDGLRDGVHTIASATTTTAREVRGRAHQVSAKDAPAAASHIRAAHGEFLKAVRSFAGKSSNEVRDELHDLAARAERTAPKVKESARRVATAADGRLGKLSNEAAQTGVKVARKAAHGVALGASGLLEGLAEAIAPPSRTATKKRASSARRAPAKKKRRT